MLHQAERGCITSVCVQLSPPADSWRPSTWPPTSEQACCTGLVHSAISTSMAYEGLRQTGWHYIKPAEQFDMAGHVKPIGLTAVMISTAYMVHPKLFNALKVLF